MRRREHDVVVIGAGAAGLTATARLAHAQKDVLCLEATGRVGGRIFTVHDRLSPHPVELGAEFVHGLPQETWAWIRRAGLTVYEQSDEAVHLDSGQVVQIGDGAERLLSGIGEKKGRGLAESFDDYLRRSRRPGDVREWARAQVEGFNAARSDLISTAALRQEARAATQIEGDRSFRILNGYDALPEAILRSIPEHEKVVQLNCVVERVDWLRGYVEVRYRSVLDGELVTVKCPRLIVTVPLGVLQAGAITFHPEPTAVLNAAASLQFGHVYRVTFRFAEPFWHEHEELRRAGFLLSKDPGFRAWWTTQPVISPMLTGWSAGAAADLFRGMSHQQVIATALQSLQRILGRKIPRPQAAWFHNWEQDPFFRGAYSYVPVHGETAHKALATPLDDTLYFAGEAAESEGHASTVHGALRSGESVATLVIQATR